MAHLLSDHGHLRGLHSLLDNNLPPPPPPLKPYTLPCVNKEPSISLDTAQRRAKTSVDPTSLQDQVSLMVLTKTCGHVVSTLDLALRCGRCAASKLICCWPSDVLYPV